MSYTGFTFRASWPILDIDRPKSALVVEASAEIDALAAESHARIAGPVTWTVFGERLIAEAPASPAVEVESAGRRRHGAVAAHLQLIEAYARRGLSDGQIAALLDCPSNTIAALRRRHRIEPGVYAAPGGRPAVDQGAAA